MRYTPDKLFPAHPDTMGENNTPTALKGRGVKTMYKIFTYVHISSKPWATSESAEQPIQVPGYRAPSHPKPHPLCRMV